MSEEWKPLGFAPDYEVSDQGRVRCLRQERRGKFVNVNERVLKSYLDNDKCVTVALRIGGSQTRMVLSRLVYESFIGPVPPLTRFQHLDGDRTNCAAANLRISDRYIREKHDHRYAGRRFGDWTVVGRAGKDVHGNALWHCRCVCGIEKYVLVGDLRRGASRNCGCQRPGAIAEKNGVWNGGINNPGSRAWVKKKIAALNTHIRSHGLGIEISSSVEEIQSLWKRAAGLCAVCRIAPKPNKSLHMVHDHATGRVRGFTCNHCNVAMGMAGDSAERLRQLADYLDSHRIADGKVRAS